MLRPRDYHVDVLAGLEHGGGGATAAHPPASGEHSAAAGWLAVGAAPMQALVGGGGGSLGADGRPAWLLQEIEANYRRQQHKAAEAAAVENDGTRNVRKTANGALVVPPTLFWHWPSRRRRPPAASHGPFFF